MSRVSSFDVFDTCLTRTFAYPVDLFLEVGEVAVKKGWISVAPEEFVTRRIMAEREARNLVASQEVSFAQIYRQLGLGLGLTPNLVSEIQNLELLIEETSLQPILETRHRIAQARQQGRQILFLSDMYLPTPFLEGLLRKHGFFEEGDFLYVSGEVGRRKTDGGLFQHARDLLKDPVTEWAHFGDSKAADVEAPRRLGLLAEHFEHGLLNRYELHLCPGRGFWERVRSRLLRDSRLDRLNIPALKASSGSRREKWKSQLVAAMRLARLAKPPDLEQRGKIIWDTGANLAGPVFYGYVKWVLEQARQKGLSRLYFVARDGQIMHKIAEIIQSIRPCSIECRYLYGSRRAWVPASLFEIDEFHLNWILEPAPDLSLRDVFSRLEIAPENHRPLLESSGFPEEIWGQPLLPAQVGRLPEVLREPVLTAEIKHMATGKREKLLEYLRAEGCFEHDNLAIVDLGGIGSLKQALAKICENARGPMKPQVMGFFFALERSRIRKGDGFHGYMNSVFPEALGGFLFYGQFLECFAAADHGQTRGYEQGRPILAEPDNPAVSAWGLPFLQESIMAFCRSYVTLEDQSAPTGEYLKTTVAALMLFYEKPTLDEIKVWGAFPYSGRRVDTELSELLPSLHRNQILTRLLTRTGRMGLWWAPALAKRENLIFFHLYYRLQIIWRTRLKPVAR